MPYAPGVQDISGQLRAAGIAQAGNAWAQAIGKVSEDIGGAYQTFKQNQYMTNQALGEFTGALKADPSLLQFLQSGGADPDNPNAPKTNVSPEVLKAFNDYSSGKHISVSQASLLGTLGRSYIKNKTENAQAQHIAMQNQLIGRQIAQMKADEDWYAAQTGQRPSLAGPTAVPAGQQIDPRVAQALSQMSVSTQGAQNVPAGVSQFLGQQPVGSLAAPPAAGEAPPPVPAAATTQQNWLNRETPPTIEDANYSFRMLNRGMRPKEGATKELLAEMRKQWDEAQTIKSTYPSIEAANKAIENIPGREGIVYAPEQLASGRVVIKPQIVPKNVLSAQEQADLAEQNRLSEEATKRNAAKINMGDVATANRGNLAAMRQAASSPDLYTGTGAEAVNALKKFAQGAGMNVKGVEDYAVLKKLAGEQLLKKVALLRPASDKDIQLLQGYLAGDVQTKEANIALIGMLERQDAYDMKQAKEIRRLRALKENGKRLPESEVDARMAQWEEDNAIQLTDAERKAFEGVPMAPAIVTGKAGTASLGRSVSNAVDQAIDPIQSAFNKWMTTPAPQKR